MCFLRPPLVTHGNLLQTLQCYELWVNPFSKVCRNVVLREVAVKGSKYLDREKSVSLSVNTDLAEDSKHE